MKNKSIILYLLGVVLFGNWVWATLMPVSETPEPVSTDDIEVLENRIGTIKTKSEDNQMSFLIELAAAARVSASPRSSALFRFAPKGADKIGENLFFQEQVFHKTTPN